MKGLATVLFSTFLLASPALAGNVYRCEGSDGVTTYANKRVSGASCKLVGSYKAQRAPRPKVAAAAPKAASSLRSSESPPPGGVPPATMASSQPAPLSAPVAVETRAPVPPVASATPTGPRLPRAG